MENKIGKHEKRKIKPTWQGGNSPWDYYYFCGFCGNGIGSNDHKCEVCKKEIDWNGVPGVNNHY